MGQRPKAPAQQPTLPKCGTTCWHVSALVAGERARTIVEEYPGDPGCAGHDLWSHACGTASGKCGANTDPGAAGGAAGHEGDDDILLRGGPPKREIPRQLV